MILHGERLTGINDLIVRCVHAIDKRATKELGLDTLVVFGYRSLEEQNMLYAQGREDLETVNMLRKELGFAALKEKENVKVTKAKQGESAHNYHMAVDLVGIKNKKAEWENLCYYDIVREEAEKAGLTSLYSIGDFGHIEINKWQQYIS